MGDVRLPKDMWLRLAFLANAFEFVDCVQECLQALTEEELTLADAFSLLNEMPEELWEHEAAMTIRIKIIQVLANEMGKQEKQRNEEEEVAAAVLMNKVTKALVGVIDELGPREMQGETAEEQKGQTIRLAGGALSKALGPVDKLFEGGMTSIGHPTGVSMGDKDRSRSDLLCTFQNKFDLADLLPLKSDTRSTLVWLLGFQWRYA